MLVETALALRGGQVVPPRANDTPNKRVLLVDDSITTRTLERSILEAAGYDVVTAADGAAAWALLAEQTVDLVVSDVDMPRMTGFALVEAIRASTAMRELPVILVTARENDADRRHGLDAGADAYIVKSGFRQEELFARCDRSAHVMRAAREFRMVVESAAHERRLAAASSPPKQRRSSSPRRSRPACKRVVTLTQRLAASMRF